MDRSVQRIPLIDVAALAVRPDDPGTARALVDASHEVGFCYVAGHRVPEPVERAALAQARAFFDLGLESKLRLSIDNTPHFRGYTPLGHEYTRGAPDWREQIDLGLDEDPESVGPEDPPWRRLRGPNQWPGELPELRMAISAWTAAMQVLALDCLRSLAIGLGQPLDFFDTYMLPRGDPHLKLIRYDGAAGMSAGAERQGVGWHHDSGLLTFILQDAAAGLEVRTPGGVAAAPPRAGTYLMNLGEMLQRATNGFLRATEHRVVSPPPGSQRLSLAYFAHPKFEARFEPIPLPPELAAAAGGGENADPDDPVFHVFGDNYLKIRLRSHPDVAARFYRDAALR